MMKVGDTGYFYVNLLYAHGLYLRDEILVDMRRVRCGLGLHST